MNPEYVVEAAVGILADLSVVFAIRNGGEIDVTHVIQDAYSLHEAVGDEEWQAAKDKIRPMIRRLFVAYLTDQSIDVRGVIEEHAAHLNGDVQ